MKTEVEAAGGRQEDRNAKAPTVRRANPKAPWEERFAILFEDLRKPARVLVNRTYAAAINAEEIEDVYANAWTSTLKALGGRERHMPDHELRSYVLTAVSNHASKEMRRRSRRPVSELKEAYAGTVADSHQPAPEELAVGAESQTVVRDLLTSLPPRRRAVMLLRYGWGMAPKEICATVPGLSSRSYRKEISKGVEELIERLGMHESGEWCRSREPLLRDYVAGVGGEEVKRQAGHHLAHCHSCTEMVGRLSGQLHDLGSTLAWTSIVSTVGEQKLSIADRIGAGMDRARDYTAGILDRGEGATETASTLASSGGTRGAGTAAGGGVLAAIGGGGAKLAAICGGTAATGACVAAVALPTGIGPFGADEPDKAKVERKAKQTSSAEAQPQEMTPSPSIDTYEPPRSPAGGSGGSTGGGGGAATPDPQPAVAQAEASQPVEAEVAPAATPPPVRAQTDPVAAAAPPPAPSGGSSSGGGGSSGGAARGTGGGEFGP
ncbi:MAG: RNA polymerase sigma factor [Solirubrobacterales bacterium]